CVKFDVGKATAIRIMRRVTYALHTLAPRFIQWPQGEKATKVMEEFERASGFPKVIEKWQLVQRTVQHFWKRWAAEYIANLQNRTKWKGKQPNLQMNDLVLIRDDNAPPLKWKLGRVIELHPGHDGFIRVVTIRTGNGIYKRSVVKLCKLPVNEDE
ncbi:hypothetical protein ALC57_07645, partial [Trachymyrmex cornetzi]